MLTESSTNNQAHLPAKIQRGKSGSPSVNSKPRQVYAQPDYFALFLSFCIFFSKGCLFICHFLPHSAPNFSQSPPPHLHLSPQAFPLNQDHTSARKQALGTFGTFFFCPSFQISKRRVNKQSFGVNLPVEPFSSNKTEVHFVIKSPELLHNQLCILQSSCLSV